MTPAPRELLKVCEHCGTWFKPKKRSTRYCSHKCNRIHYKILARQVASPSGTSRTNQNRSGSLPFVQKDKEFLSVTETYSLLGISRRTLYRLINGGELPVRKIGARTIILRTDIDSLFKKL